MDNGRTSPFEYAYSVVCLHTEDFYGGCIDCLPVESDDWTILYLHHCWYLIFMELSRQMPTSSTTRISNRVLKWPDPKLFFRRFSARFCARSLRRASGMVAAIIAQSFQRINDSIEVLCRQISSFVYTRDADCERCANPLEMAFDRRIDISRLVSG